MRDGRHWRSLTAGHGRVEGFRRAGRLTGEVAILVFRGAIKKARAAYSCGVEPAGERKFN